MVAWYWLLGVGWGCFLFGMATHALFSAASDRRHDRRIRSRIAGRSYFESTRREG